MGSEQSSSSRRGREREYYEERIGRESAATPRDVERALEQQRKLYEQKIKELIRENKNTNSTATTPATVPTPTTSRTVPAQPALTRPSTLGNHCSAAASSSVDQSLERQPAPYAYTHHDLQNRASASSNTQNLYPNLVSGYSTLSPRDTPSPSLVVYSEAQRTRNVAGRSADFNFVNNHFVQQHSPLSPPNQSFQPSAPPIETSSANSRSRSRVRGQDADISCPTCSQMFGERIFQCGQGHSSCDTCKTRQVPCGQCRQHITNRRNFDLEKYVSERKVKCPNSADGCCLFIRVADMGIHEKECPFKAMYCPSLGSYCPWKGKMSQLAEHFDSMHPTHRQADVDKEMFLSNITKTSHTMHYVQIGPFNFMFHLKVSENDKMIYMAVQLIGTKTSAAKWEYEVHVYNKRQARRKFLHIDRCSSNSESIQSIVDSMKCAVIPLEYAKTFICEGVLAYKFYVKRDEVKIRDNVKVKKEWRNKSRWAQRNHSKDNGGNQ